jgi:DNA ligase D-like protein (predicted ligase)
VIERAVDRLSPTDRSRLALAPAVGWRAPMLPSLAGTPPAGAGWVFERKFDGVRVIASRDGGRTALFSRTQRAVDASYPELAEALSAQPATRFVVDGEIVAFDGARTSFERLQARIHLTRPDQIRATGVSVVLCLFDLLVIGDVDVTRVSLRSRKELLQEAFAFDDTVRFSADRVGDGAALFAEACAQGWEGLIAKRADSPYRSGRRSTDWLKYKCVREQEFVIGGFTDPSGTRLGFGALLLGYYDGDQLRYAGKVGTGFTDATLRDLRSQLDRLSQRECPFADRVGERGAHWARPELVAQAGFSDWTDDGKLRHARFLGLRADKPARDVVREMPA